MDISGHIFRRGVDAYFQPRDGTPATPGEPQPVIELPTWVIMMLLTTTLGFVFLFTMVGGVLGRVRTWNH